MYGIYEEVLRNLRFAKSVLNVTEAHRLAFRRLVFAATKVTKDSASESVGGVFHGAPYELLPLVAEEIDLLLGNAAILDTELLRLDSEKAPQGGNMLSAMERESRRMRLSTLRDTFLNWACAAAGKEGPVGVDKILSFLHGLPESSERLRYAIIGQFHKLMVSTDNLAVCLPDYYSALVGSSQLLRSAAAKVLGEIDRPVLQNLPALVFEAFSALLSNSYVIVHRTAVRALEHFHLPPEFDVVAHANISNIILYYARSRSDDEFLMTAIDLYARRYLKGDDIAGPIGATLIAIMMRMKPSAVGYEIRHSARQFLSRPDYPALLFRVMEDEQAMSLYHEDLIDQLARLPKSSVYQERDKLVALGMKLWKSDDEIIGILVEGLTAAGAWNEGAELTAAVYAQIEDTTRNRPVRLHAALRSIACSYEAAIANGKPDALEDLHNHWKSTLTEIETDRAAYANRRDPLRGILGSN